MNKSLKEIRYKEVEVFRGASYLKYEVPVDAETGLQISSFELAKLHASLSAVGYYVVFAHPPCMMGKKANLPLRGTVTDIDDSYVYVEGEDGESYNIHHDYFHGLYDVAST